MKYNWDKIKPGQVIYCVKPAYKNRLYSYQRVLDFEIIKLDVVEKNIMAGAKKN